MATQVLPGEAFLNKYYLDERLRMYLEPALYFNGKLPTKTTTSRSFIYDVQDNTAAQDIADGVMTLPLPTDESAGLTELKMTEISERKGRALSLGYRVPVSPEKLTEQVRAESEIDLITSKMAYGISYKANKLILDTLYNGATSSSYSPGATWATSTDILKDIIEVWYEMKQPAYANRAINWFLNTVNHKEMVEHLNDLDIDFQLNDNVLTIPNKPQLSQMEFMDVEDQMTEGNGLIMDLRGGAIYPGAEVYRYIEPDHAVRALDGDGNPTNNFTGIHVNVDVLTKKPFTRYIEMWINLVPVIKNDDVILKQAGI